MKLNSCCLIVVMSVVYLQLYVYSVISNISNFILIKRSLYLTNDLNNYLFVMLFV